MDPFALDLALWETTVLLVAAVLGGAAQSGLGFGAAFTIAPALALVAPELLPGAIIAGIVPLSVTMLARGRDGLDLRAVGRVTLGRLPGIALGAGVVAALDERLLTAVIGVILLAAVVASAGGWSLRVTGPREAVAGVVSGFTGTTAGLGGPPLALLYRGQPGHVLRPTLAGVWLVGSPLALGALAAAGSLTAVQLRAGALLGAAMLLGLTLAAPMVRRMPDAALQHTILAWAAVGAVGALVRTLTGA